MQEKRMKQSDSQIRREIVVKTLSQAMEENWSFDKVKEILDQHYDVVDGHSVRYLCKRHLPHLLNEYTTWWGNNKGNHKYTGRIKDYSVELIDKLSERLELKGVRYDDPY